MTDRASSLPLHAWRRLDWRFLLPAAASGPVLCVGEPDDDLRSALPLLDARVEHVTSAEQWDALTRRPELVVLVDPDLDDLWRAVSVCRPGGWIYAEVRRSWARPRGPRTIGGWRRALRAAGLEQVGAHWHFRTVVASRRIISVDAGEALHHSAGRRRWAWFAGAPATMVRLVCRLRLLPLVIREGSVVGRRPVAGTAGR